MRRAHLRLLLLGVLAAAGGLASAETRNPPPAQAFSAYSGFELKPIRLSDAEAAQKGKDNAAAKVQVHFDALVAPIVAEWNARKPAAEGAPHLVIEPRIDTIKKVGGATRFFAGGFAGDSHVTMHLRFVEQPGDKVIAEPEFYQRAAALSGAYTMGAQDNDMLRRIAQVVADYLHGNFDGATGGRTGRPD
jgi:hypothetical protein